MPPEVSLEGVFLLAWRISPLYRHITRAVSGVSPWGKYPGFWRGLEEYPDTRERGVSSTLKGRETGVWSCYFVACVLCLSGEIWREKNIPRGKSSGEW